MNEAEIQKRLEEERSESAGWAEVLANFSQGYFSKLHCPHCGSDRQFEYLTHAHGFTVRCREMRAICTWKWWHSPLVGRRLNSIR